MHKYVFDIESYPDAFVAVFKLLGNSSRSAFRDFAITDWGVNQLQELRSFLIEESPALIGYNSIGYDAQLLQLIIDGRVDKAYDLFSASKVIIDDKRKIYAESSFSNHHLDLYLVGSYNTPSRQTSLKWLEYSLRMKVLADLPFDFNESVRTDARLSDVISYCRKDVQATESVYLHHDEELEMRRGICAKYGRTLLNKSNSQIGEAIILHEYCQKTNRSLQDIRAAKKEYPSVSLKDIILPNIEITSKELKPVFEAYRQLKIKSDDKGEIPIKGGFSKTVDLKGAKVDYGVGGLHGLLRNGLYKSEDGKIIVTSDVASMYPNIAIKNFIYPKHLGVEYCDVYEGIYLERKKHAKGTPLNLAYKEALNSTFGKSNSKYSDLFDPTYFLGTTINGQLFLSMLAERLCEIGQPIMLNTDGVEFLIDQNDLDAYYEICNAWQDTSGLELEHDLYDWMAIRDVNNYVAKTQSGKVKRKGAFLTYEDYKGDWHKNPSFTVIPKAVSNYLIDGTPIKDSIMSETNVFEFMGGVKGGKNFEYWLFVADEHKNIKYRKYGERAVRYYFSTEGGTMMKYFKDGRKNTLQKLSGTSNKLVDTAMVVKKEYIEYYPDIDYSIYITAAEELLSSILEC